MERRTGRRPARAGARGLLRLLWVDVRQPPQAEERGRWSQQRPPIPEEPVERLGRTGRDALPAARRVVVGHEDDAVTARKRTAPPGRPGRVPRSSSERAARRNQNQQAARLAEFHDDRVGSARRDVHLVLERPNTAATASLRRSPVSQARARYGPSPRVRPTAPEFEEPRLYPAAFPR